MTHLLPLFHEAAPNDKDVLVYVQQPIGKPGPQLIGKPRLQSPAGRIGGWQSLDAVSDFRDRNHAQVKTGRVLTVRPRLDPRIAVRFAQFRDDVGI